MSDALVRMINIQAHRGPNDHGMSVLENVALGHNRLSIIDLSANGRQPMVTADGRLSLIFNGEIYNYLELREELGGADAYRSDTDSEVLLNAYRAWGPQCVERLRGMFAFAIWDRDRRELFLARDRFGIKPAYFASSRGHFYFASEIKGLLAAGVPRRPDMRVVGEYLATGQYDHRPATFFEGISRLMPGHALIVGGGGIVQQDRAYYELEDHIDAGAAKLSAGPARDRYRAKLEESIAIHLRSDVPIGVSLSGGIDSSALLALSLRSDAPLMTMHSFLYDFADPRYSERHRVERTIAQVGGRLHTCLMSPTDCRDALWDTTWVQGEPFGGVPTMSMAAVYHRARGENVTVLLNGNGADDALAGSRREATAYIRSLSTAGSKHLFEREMSGYMGVWGVDRAAANEAISNVGGPQAASLGADNTEPVAAEVVRASYRCDFDPGVVPERFSGSLMRQGLYRRMFRSKIPRTLRFDDHNSMAASREVRVPFLDHELVELSFSLAEEHLIRGGLGKFVLRDALKTEIPESVRIEPKQSVQSPQREWFKNGNLSEIVRGVLEDPCDLLAEVIDINAARDRFKRYRAGDDSNSNFLWQWINLDTWYRTFIEDFRPQDHAPTVTASARYPVRNPAAA